jgi:hypothetical protein
MIDELKKYFETTSKEKIMENNEKMKNMPPTKNETNN